MKSFEKSDTKLILVGKDVRDIASGNVSTWKMMQQLFTPEAANVTYLGVVPYKNKDTLLKQRYVCFQHLQKLCLFPGSKQWLWKSYCRFQYWLG
jgi:hypothetical protein